MLSVEGSVLSVVFTLLRVVEFEMTERTESNTSLPFVLSFNVKSSQVPECEGGRQKKC